MDGKKGTYTTSSDPHVVAHFKVAKISMGDLVGWMSTAGSRVFGSIEAASNGFGRAAIRGAGGLRRPAGRGRTRGAGLLIGLRAMFLGACHRCRGQSEGSCSSSVSQRSMEGSEQSLKQLQCEDCDDGEVSDGLICDGCDCSEKDQAMRMQPSNDVSLRRDSGQR